jgi:hypothetical protein
MALSPEIIEDLDALIIREHTVVTQQLHYPLEIFAHSRTHVCVSFVSEEIANVLHF